MNKLRYYLLIALALFIIFLSITAFGAYLGALQVRKFVVERELPVTGMAVAAKLEYAAYRYLKMGEELLEDDILRDWILSGEKDPDRAISFMKGVEMRYKLLDASVVSDKSETYYSSDGRILSLSPENKARDGWYYLYREKAEGGNIDSWHDPETGLIWIFVNVPIYDQEGGYIGVTGAGIDSREFGRIIEAFELSRSVSFSLIRSDGKIVYQTLPHEEEMLSGDVLDQLSRNREGPAGISIGTGDSGLDPLWGTWLSEWNSYLVVQKDQAIVGSTWKGAALKLFFYLGVPALLLFLLTLFALGQLYLSLNTTFGAIENKIALERAWIFTLERMMHRFVQDDQIRSDPAEIWAALNGSGEETTLYLQDELESSFSRLIDTYGSLGSIFYWDIAKGDFPMKRGSLLLLIVVVKNLLFELAELSPEEADILLTGIKRDNSYTLIIAAEVIPRFLSSEGLGAAKRLLQEIGSEVKVLDGEREGVLLKITIPPLNSDTLPS
jgi:hypothetical protein